MSRVCFIYSLSCLMFMSRVTSFCLSWVWLLVIIIEHCHPFFVILSKRIKYFFLKNLDHLTQPHRTWRNCINRKMAEFYYKIHLQISYPISPCVCHIYTYTLANFRDCFCVEILKFYQIKNLVFYFHNLQISGFISNPLCIHIKESFQIN